MVSNEVKSAAHRLGLEKKNFSTHSIKIGSISTVTASGADSSTIMQLGGHRSQQSSILYRRPTKANRGALSYGDSLLNIGDLRRMAVASNPEPSQIQQHF